jgi:hypothetical protein
MRIISKLGLLSILLAFCFAFVALSALPAPAESVGPTKNKAKYQQAKPHKATKQAIRAKTARTAPAQTTTGAITASTVCYTVPTWDASGYTWSGVATYGATAPQQTQSQTQAMPAASQTAPIQGSVTVCYHPVISYQGAASGGWNSAAGSGMQPAAPSQVQSAQAVPQALPGQAQATICYNPCVSCWNVPATTWSAPATAGRTWRDTLRNILPPPPRPAVVSTAPAQPQAATGMTTVCTTVNPGPTW